MDQEAHNLRDSLDSALRAELVYYGYWFAPERRVAGSS